MSALFAVPDRAAAERRAERIRLRLDSIADNITAVLPMIREAIEAGDATALGYRSVGEYVSDRFGGALSRLPVDLRRPVVHELASADMSTRAIAPVVGAGLATVHRDLHSGVPGGTPAVDTESGEVADDYEASTWDEAVEQHHQNRPTVTGIDGKTYTRPEPAKPKPRKRPLPLHLAIGQETHELQKVVTRLDRLTTDERLSRLRATERAKAKNEVARLQKILFAIRQRLAGGAP